MRQTRGLPAFSHEYLSPILTVDCPHPRSIAEDYALYFLQADRLISIRGLSLWARPQVEAHGFGENRYLSRRRRNIISGSYRGSGCSSYAVCYVFWICGCSAQFLWAGSRLMLQTTTNRRAYRSCLVACAVRILSH